VSDNRIPDSTEGVVVFGESELPEIYSHVPYSKRLAHEITDFYQQGETIASISRRPGMPHANVIYRWIKVNEEFREMFNSARASKALYHEDKALEAAENAPAEDGTAAERLRFDAHRWAAEMADPTRFGKKVTHEGNADKPIQFIISTGFPPPNEHQTPPEIGPDGLIKKLPQDIVIKSEEINHESSEADLGTD